jgi:4-hydroxy-3-methylbut-2-enyl diphosphate reductase
MQVIRAGTLGFCFGVRDALSAAFDLDQPKSVTIHGELVHNRAVQDRLRERGFRQTAEAERDALPSTDQVLVTAHGISNRERERLAAAGKQLIDTTCPLVAHLHARALSAQSEGFHVILIGKRGHVEVNGVLGDLESATLVQSVEDVSPLPHDKLAICAQTTTPASVAEAILARVRELHPRADVRYHDTICAPTKQRIQAVMTLAGEVELMVIVGGRNSNNTLQLVATARARGTRVRHVESAEELQPHWFLGRERIGLAAGTSTPDELLARVEARLAEIGALLGARV